LGKLLIIHSHNIVQEAEENIEKKRKVFEKKRVLRFTFFLLLLPFPEWKPRRNLLVSQRTNVLLCLHDLAKYVPLWVFIIDVTECQTVKIRHLGFNLV